MPPNSTIILSEISDIINLELPRKPLYEIPLNDIKGQKIDLENYRGKNILFVNIASKCGLRKQYKELQKLQNEFLKKLVVIGVPCNQFLNQEPGTNTEIDKNCRETYKVDFLITEKMKVKGDDQHPLYRWLTDKEYNGRITSKVVWNFQKYLVGENGSLIDFFYPLTKPNSIRITQYLD